MDLEKMNAQCTTVRQFAWMPLVAMLAMACAQVGSPTGGPKDETPSSLDPGDPAFGRNRGGAQPIDFGV